jgi:hypothetical protein
VYDDGDVRWYTLSEKKFWLEGEPGFVEYSKKVGGAGADDTTTDPIGSPHTTDTATTSGGGSSAAPDATTSSSTTSSGANTDWYSNYSGYGNNYNYKPQFRPYTSRDPLANTAVVFNVFVHKSTGKKCKNLCSGP